MAESHVLFALKRQYGKTLGALHAAHSDRARIMGDLGHLAAVIRMFSPEEDLEAIKPVRPYREVRFRWRRTAIAILREEGAPMTARTLALRVLKAHNVDLIRRNIKGAECSLHAVLERLEGRGIVKVGGNPKRWRIEP